MIVELFGPPCAGKTTFARHLAAGLAVRGFQTRTTISARASEGDEAEAATGAGCDPLWRERLDDCEDVNRTLLRLLPPRSPLWRLRLRRYLRLLASAWARDAAAAPVVFDQGYTQALCSLVSLARSSSPAALHAAAAVLPRPAVRINLTVPGDVLRQRLAQRSRGLTLRERLLEPDTATILEQDRICATLFDLLGRDGEILRTTSSATNDIAPILEAIASRLHALQRPHPVGPGGFKPRILKEVGRS